MTKREEKAIECFSTALRMDVLMWSAYQELCSLGEVSCAQCSAWDFWGPDEASSPEPRCMQMLQSSKSSRLEFKTPRVGDGRPISGHAGLASFQSSSQML